MHSETEVGIEEMRDSFWGTLTEGEKKAEDIFQVLLLRDLHFDKALKIFLVMNADHTENNLHG